MSGQLLPTDLQPWKCLEGQCSACTKKARAGREKAGVLERICQKWKAEARYKERGCKSELEAKAVKSLSLCDPDVSDISVLD